MMKPFVFGVTLCGVLVAAVTARGVTIEVGSTSGSPGGSAAVGVTLRTTGADVTAVAHDLAVDARTPIASCTVNPLFAEVGVVNLFPDDCETTSDDCIAARAVLAQFSHANIPDGTVLYSCDLSIAGDAQGSYPIVCSNPEASDANSNPLSSTCSDGAVSVGGADFCVGDCNDDNEVFGNEVTIAINILAGNAELSICQNADANGDMEVFGNEVTIAINKVANGCEE